MAQPGDVIPGEDERSGTARAEDERVPESIDEETLFERRKGHAAPFRP